MVFETTTIIARDRHSNFYFTREESDAGDGAGPGRRGGVHSHPGLLVAVLLSTLLLILPVSVKSFLRINSDIKIVRETFP